jgi:hypothetical protein
LTERTCFSLFIRRIIRGKDALEELARISKPRGLVYIGEVPCLNEFEGKQYGDSIAAWLFWVLRNQGIAEFMARLRQTILALSSREPLLIYPKAHFFSEPDKFVEKATSHGLTLKTHFRHREITSTGDEFDSESRWDYLFEKTE